MLRKQDQEKNIEKRYESIKDSLPELTAELDRIKKIRLAESKTSCIGIRGPNYALLECYDQQISVLEEMIRKCPDVSLERGSTLSF